MKFELMTLECGGNKVFEQSCNQNEILDKIKDALNEYDKESHMYDIEYVNILTNTGKKVVSAQNRCIGGYSFCCWSEKDKNSIDKKWQKKFNDAFGNTGAYMGW